MGSTVVPVLLYSDKTRLTNLGGDKQAWPVYLSIGNISKDVRNRTSNHCWVPVAYLPVAKFIKDAPDINGVLEARLFHQCLRIVFDSLVPSENEGAMLADSEGNVRHCFPRIAAYLCDYPEQCMVLGIAKNCSPTHFATFENLDDPDPGPLRTREAMMDLINPLRDKYHEDVPADIRACNIEAKLDGLIGVLHPFWEHHIDFQPWRCMPPDVLHGLHRFFRDHMFDWIQWLVGTADYDRRLSSLQPLVGIRHFREGVGSLSQWTGREDRDLQRTIAAVALGGKNVTARCLKALRALLDFIYIAQYESQNPSTLEYLSTALRDFHRHKSAFIDTGARRGQNGTIPHFRIPKLYAFHSYIISIKALGSTPQFSTEYGERAHIPLAKDLYRGTNHKDFGGQMCRALDRKERLRSFLAFIAWSEAELIRRGSKSASKSREKKKKKGQQAGAADPGNRDRNKPVVSLARTAHSLYIPINRTAQKYKLPDLEPALRFFFLSSSYQHIVWRYARGTPEDQPHRIPYTHIDIWKQLRLQPSKVQDEDSDAVATTLQALPPGTDYPLGRCNCVLIRKSDSAERTGIAGETMHYLSQLSAELLCLRLSDWASSFDISIFMRATGRSLAHKTVRVYPVVSYTQQDGENYQHVHRCSGS